jgi:hypothetical protein
MSPRPHVLVFMFCMGIALVLLAPLAAAPPKGAKKDTVEVAVIAILATDRHNQINPKLDCIARQVRKTRKELTGFQLATMTSQPLPIGVSHVFEVVGNQKVGVTVLRGADEKDRVQVKVAPPGMGEITYDTCCGKFLPIVTEFRTKDKELLIIAVCVRPCHEK